MGKKGKKRKAEERHSAKEAKKETPKRQEVNQEAVQN